MLTDNLINKYRTLTLEKVLSKERKRRRARLKTNVSQEQNCLNEISETGKQNPLLQTIELITDGSY